MATVGRVGDADSGSGSTGIELGAVSGGRARTNPADTANADAGAGSIDPDRDHRAAAPVMPKPVRVRRRKLTCVQRCQQRGGRGGGTNSLTCSDLPSTTRGRVVALLVFALLVVSLFYAAGGWFLVVNVANQAGSGLPTNDDASVWWLGFPFRSVLGMRIDTPALPNGLANTNTLPFFAEALPFFLISVAIEAVVAALVARRKRMYRANDAVNSLSLGVLSQVCGVFFGAASVVPYTYVYQNWAVYRLPADEPWVWWLMFFGVDFCYYWFHRTSHHNNVWWGQHVVHHTGEEYNLATALRQPSLSGISFIFYLPLAFFLPVRLARAHKTFNLLYQFWIHTRLIGTLGPLEWVLNTPSHHRVHHGRNPYCIDKNFAGTLIIWDRMFGTFQAERPDEEIMYGILPPMKTFNPVWQNLATYYDFIKTVVATPGLLNKCSMFWHGPGWRYDARQQQCRLYKVPRIGHRLNPKTKHDPAIPRDLSLYALSQFAVLAGVFFVVKVGEHPLLTTVLVAGFFAVSLVSVASVLDGRRWCLHSELARLVFTAAAASGVLLATGGSFVSPPFVAVWVILLASMVFVSLKLRASAWHSSWLRHSAHGLLGAPVCDDGISDADGGGATLQVPTGPDSAPASSGATSVGVATGSVAVARGPASAASSSYHVLQS